MKNRLLLILLVLSLGLNLGFLLHWSWPKIVSGHSAGRGQSQLGWHASPMKQHLGLSSDQARRMENERRQVLAQVLPLQDELRLKRRELFVLLKGKAVTDAELDVALSGIARLQTAIEKMFILHSLKVKAFFTPAQLQKYEAFFEQGLCPGMGAGASCLPGKMSGRGPGRPGCDYRPGEIK
jgi:hypothetical protein